MDSCVVRAFNKQELLSSSMGDWSSRNEVVILHSQEGPESL
jgi:hypothetical protein